jgi:glycosyltransferase involved in cell wall biosynthesis
MASKKRTIGVLGGRDPREFGGVESVVRNTALHAGDHYEFRQYCTAAEAWVAESDLGTIRARSDRFGPLRSKHLSSLRAARDLRERDVDLVHGHGDNVLGLSVFSPPQPYVVTFHGTVAGMYANLFDDAGIARDLLSRIRPLPERSAARQCDVAVACSAQVREELVSYYGIDREKITTIPNGVDADRFAPMAREDARGRLGLDADGSYALWVGTDPHRKGLGVATAAVGASAADVRLLVAGVDGDDTETVRYLGRVPDEQMAALYSAADLLLFPSRYEGFGLVVLEALSCGTPVVASPAIPRFDTGVSYVDGHEPVRYARALESLLADPPDGTELRQFALDRDWRRVATEYVDLFERLLRDQ